MLVQECRDRFILKALALHHMAPVACAVANGEKDRLLFGFGFLERFLAPGEPINGIMGVLLEIGRSFERQTVHCDRTATLPLPLRMSASAWLASVAGSNSRQSYLAAP